MNTPGKQVFECDDGNSLMMPRFDLRNYQSLLDSSARATPDAKAKSKPAAKRKAEAKPAANRGGALPFIKILFFGQNL